jgi:hypothetical protein
MPGARFIKTLLTLAAKYFVPFLKDGTDTYAGIFTGLPAEFYPADLANFLFCT